MMLYLFNGYLKYRLRDHQLRGTQQLSSSTKLKAATAGTQELVMGRKMSQWAIQTSEGLHDQTLHRSLGFSTSWPNSQESISIHCRLGLQCFHPLHGPSRITHRNVAMTGAMCFKHMERVYEHPNKIDIIYNYIYRDMSQKRIEPLHWMSMTICQKHTIRVCENGKHVFQLCKTWHLKSEWHFWMLTIPSPWYLRPPSMVPSMWNFSLRNPKTWDIHKMSCTTRVKPRSKLSTFMVPCEMDDMEGGIPILGKSHINP